MNWNDNWKKLHRQVEVSNYIYFIFTICFYLFICVWQLKGDGSINFVADNCPKIGHLHCARFCPDSDTKLVVGGERDGLVRVVDLGKTTGIKQTFNLES
jgi:hypothetical protein